MSDQATKSHPIRFLLRLAIFAGLTGFAVKMLNEKKKELQGMTESEARAKFESKMAPKMGAEKAAQIIDEVIPKLVDRGVILPDPPDQTMKTEAGAAVTDLFEASSESEQT